MTNPLTPREKVADRLCDKVQAEYPNILTALASISGDHAELARLADMSACVIARHGCAPSLDDLPSDPENWSGFAHAKILAEHRVALLAEIAALNDYGRSVAKEALGYRDRATEAERKLAEAVGLVERSIDLMTDEYADTKAYREEARTFLSKEAERG